jgi:bifunctional non-homologous end joining protein LigD
MLPKMTPMRLTQQAKPFDHPEWLFEVKFDGFRSLAYIDGECELISRKGITYTRFQELRDRMTLDHSAILDGEIVCLDSQGRSQFYDLMFNRGEAHFYAFDLLWLDGEDLRDRPLVERKAILKGLVDGTSILYLDHIQEQGVALFDQCVKLDLEGIVAKPEVSPYRELKGKTTWIKIKNPEYSQAEGRRDLFNAPRRVDKHAAPQKRRKP